MVNPIPYFARNVWSKWDIQIVILTSFCLQITLTMLGYLRKTSSRRSILFMFLWFIYLFADSTAIFCIGLIPSKFGDKDTQISKDKESLLAFWAPFLLLHLGGPDTITAFSLEDNQLWLRHLLGLIVQVCLTGYVFLLTIPNNPLWLPTTMVLVAGIIKFGERIRSLQLASPRNLPKTEFTSPPRTSDEELPDVMVVMHAYGYLNTLKAIVSDELLLFSNRSRRVRFFGTLTAIDALRIIEVELDLLYETFYTKASVIYNKLGFCFRFLSLGLVVAALFLFVSDKKRGCDLFDVKVTYVLLCGAVAMDVVSFLMLIFSNHFFGSLYFPDAPFASFDDFEKPFSGFLKPKRRQMWKERMFEERMYMVLCKTTLGCKWSYSISGFNLISYCLHNKRESWVDKVMNKIGAKELVEKMKYEKQHPLLQKLWTFIFSELKRNAAYDSAQKICTSRGGRVIQNGKLPPDDIKTLMRYVDTDEVSFDECVFTWHLATDLLFYYESEDLENGRDEEGIVPKHDQDFDFRDFSKILSDYMLYLSVMQPTMMSVDRKIGFDKMFKSTCDWTINIFREKNIMGVRDKEEKEMRKSSKERKACKELNMHLHDHDFDYTQLQIPSPIELAKDIKNLQARNKWEIVAQVWVEILTFAACNSTPVTHVQHLAKGTEFLSHVWLLVDHFHLTKRFRPELPRDRLLIGPRFFL